MNLKELRKDAKLTQKELANRVGCTNRYISALECGRVTPSNQMKLDLLAALHGRGISYRPPVVPFESEKQKRDLRAAWLERGYGTE